MTRICTQLLATLLLVFAFMGATSEQATAGGWHHHRGHHTSFVLGLNFGLSPYYYRPPVYYAPPPRVIYVTPPAAANCRLFRGDATIDASGRPFFGTACFGNDGRWHIAG